MIRSPPRKGIFFRKCALTSSYAAKDHSCDPIESESAKEFYSKAEENLLLKSANNAMVSLQHDDLHG
jgi:hypothetical protein